MFKASDRVDEILLYILGKRGAYSIEIHLLSADSLWLNKDMVPIPIGKSNHFIFDRRAITRSCTGDFSTVEWTSPNIRLNDLVGTIVGVGDMAGKCRSIHRLIVERERHHELVARLELHHREIDGRLSHPGRSSRLQPSHGEPLLPESCSESDSSGLPEASR